MEFKHLSIEWKADDQGQIEGYGSVFDTVDLGGDIVAPGAFKQSLAGSRRVKMLFQHDKSSVVGVWNTMEEDAKGLRVAGRMLTTVRAGAEAYELVKAGAIDGLSIGFSAVKSIDRNGKRVILQADLWEVSLVTFPMNEMARIDAVKAAGLSERELERMLTRDAGLSRSVALALMGGGYNGIKAMRDAGDDGAEEVASLLRLRTSL
jgi:HK97 family phage prohead protease